ncbi:MAG: glycosyltransferase [Mycobacterium sp.]|uniref:glycosyltransferase n=1 Tax=Mycobacterium sp. TaxID=1785 RepID=UPI001EBAF088|nr:nucleotide disphospho-sugar-binding domain-containing protein [Mycobacterium sp.]MBW0019607.1 glycosyltransferase [Mycobacterium sp.]
MATILAYGSPSLGHVYPMGALLSQLAWRGHEVHVRTMSSEVAVMRQVGVHAEPVAPRIEAIASQDWLGRNALDVLKMSIEVLCRRAVFEVEDARGAIEDVRPDAVVVDANCWGAMSAVDAGDVPWAIFSPFTPYLQARDVPPFGPGLRPLPGMRGRIRDRVMRRFVAHLFDRPVLPRINAIRAQLEIPPVNAVDQLIRRAPLLLAVGGEPFEYPCREWADFVHFVGACSFEPPSEPMPAWLEGIDRPVVLVNTSSIRQADRALAVAAMQALADEPLHVVVTFPAGVPAGLRPTPNATVCRFVPHGPLLDRAVCAITHGGMGSTVRALERGVPVCAVPFARDQPEVARRVEVAGCGTRLPAKRLTVGRLKAAVLRAITMTDGARRVAEGFVATGGVQRGADLVEQEVLRCGIQPASRDW